jgi:hypothetical protein
MFAIVGEEKEGTQKRRKSRVGYVVKNRFKQASAQHSNSSACFVLSSFISVSELCEEEENATWQDH